jgi:hypothetical protein
MSSDGIYNEGKNPLYQNFNMTSPIYTIALGDTTIRKDLSVSNVIHNKVSYLGDESIFQVDISAKNSNGASAKVSLSRVEGAQKIPLGTQNISFQGNEDFKTVNFNVETNKAGIIKYEVTVSPISGEVSIINNTRIFYVEVLDARQKILILADGPHPDMAALHRSITSNKNYDVVTAFAGDNNAKVADYDLMIFHNLPSKNYDIKEILDIINRKGTPRLYIAGTQISSPSFNSIQNVLSIEGNSTANEDVQPNLRNDFSLFTLSQEVHTALNKYPPLTSKFGSYKLGSSGQALLDQKIKKIPTKYPLLAFSNQSGLKAAVLAGEGLWKWRIFDFQEKQNYIAFDELVNKTIQYLTVKEDKRKFRVNSSKNIYKETDNIVFDAQLYNNSYEMINEPEVQMSIKDENNKEYQFTLSKSNNYYTLNAGQFPEGNYKYKAKVNFNGQNLSAEGNIRVEKIQLEQYDLTANHKLLAGLSQKYNGKLYYPNQIKALKEELLNNKNIKPAVYLSKKSLPMMHQKWIFFSLLIFLALEWFLRRYFGTY